MKIRINPHNTDAFESSILERAFYKIDERIEESDDDTEICILANGLAAIARTLEARDFHFNQDTGTWEESSK